jgi:hypothetical protein
VVIKQNGRKRMQKRVKADEYRPEYAEKLIAWFKNAPLYHREMRTVFSKKSDKSEEISEKTPAPCPTFVRFADEIGVTIGSLEKWRAKYPEFAEAYLKAVLYQEEWLMNAAGLGFYNSSMSITALKANHGWVEKGDAKNRAVDNELKQVLVRFVKDSELKTETGEKE